MQLFRENVWKDSTFLVIRNSTEKWCNLIDRLCYFYISDMYNELEGLTHQCEES